MMSIKVEGMDRLAAQLRGIEKQVRFATVLATTRTAKLVQAETAEEMNRKFDRPTRITLKSMWVKPATKENMAAVVYLKDKPLGRGFDGAHNPMSMKDIIGHQFSGGNRNATNFERLMRAQRFLAAEEFFVPGGGARLNAYGNVASGQYVQIMSQLRITRSGSDSTSTNSKRSKRNVQRAGEMFWSFGAEGKTGGRPLVDKETGITYGFAGRAGRANHLPKGVWVRRGASVSPVLLAIKGPRYRRLIFLDVIAKRVVDAHFKAEFDKALAFALDTKR